MYLSNMMAINLKKVSYREQIASANRKFFQPRVFCAPAEWVPFGIGYLRWETRNYNNGATEPKERCDNSFCRVDTVHKRNRQTDGQTPGDSKDRAYE